MTLVVLVAFGALVAGGMAAGLAGRGFWPWAVGGAVAAIPAGILAEGWTGPALRRAILSGEVAPADVPTLAPLLSTIGALVVVALGTGLLLALLGRRRDRAAEIEAEERMRAAARRKIAEEEWLGRPRDRLDDFRDELQARADAQARRGREWASLMPVRHRPQIEIVARTLHTEILS